MRIFSAFKVYKIFYANLADLSLNYYLYISMKRIIIICFALLLNACGQSPAKPEQAPAQKPVQKTTIKKDIFVAIQPMQGPGKELCELLAKQIELFYGFKAEIMEETNLPEYAWYAARNRYRADRLLNHLLRVKPLKYDYIIGITEKDISCTKDAYADWGVFGLGFMPGASCVVSTFRLKRNMRSEEHFRERVIKVVLHELGHNIGLPHCPTKGCMMQDANGTIKSVDEEKIEVCDLCKEKIKKFKEK